MENRMKSIMMAFALLCPLMLVAVYSDRKACYRSRGNTTGETSKIIGPAFCRPPPILWRRSPHGGAWRKLPRRDKRASQKRTLQQLADR